LLPTNERIDLVCLSFDCMELMLLLYFYHWLGMTLNVFLMIYELLACFARLLPSIPMSFELGWPWYFMHDGLNYCMFQVPLYAYFNLPLFGFICHCLILSFHPLCVLAVPGLEGVEDIVGNLKHRLNGISWYLMVGSCSPWWIFPTH